MDRRPKEVEELARRQPAITELVQEARANGDSLTGPSDLLKDLTKMMLEVSLEAEMTEHLGHSKHEPSAPATTDAVDADQDEAPGERVRNVRNRSGRKRC